MLHIIQINGQEKGVVVGGLIDLHNTQKRKEEKVDNNSQK